MEGEVYAILVPFDCSYKIIALYLEGMWRGPQGFLLLQYLYIYP